MKPTAMRWLLVLLLLSHSWDGSEPSVHRITITECRLLPKPRLLHRFRFAIPVQGKLCGIEFSPSGNRIAWDFSKNGGKPGMRRREVWICNIEGRRWRKVGDIEMTADDEPNHGFGVDWLPGSNALSFTWNDALWIVPVNRG